MDIIRNAFINQISLSVVSDYFQYRTLKYYSTHIEICDYGPFKPKVAGVLNSQCIWKGNSVSTAVYLFVMSPR
jgi:hypothetical protein